MVGSLLIYLLPIIPVLTISIAFSITRSIVEDEINRSNVLELGKVRDRIDKIIDDTKRFSMEVAGGQSMQEVFPLTEIDSETPYYALYNASQELKNYKFLDGSLKRFYLFFNKLEIVIAPGTIYDQAIYYNGFVASKEYSYNLWLDTMRKKYDGDFLLMPYYQDGAGEQKAVAFIKSPPILNFGDYAANMVVLLDFQDLIVGSDNFGSYSKERSLFIIDEKGTTIACAGMSQIPAGLDGHEMEKDSGNFSKIIDNDKFVISYLSSHINGWKYITVTAESLFWEKVRFIKDIMIGAVFLSITAGGIVSYFSLRKNYNPLKEIVSLLQEKLHSQSDRKDNEYGFIRHAFSETLEQKERIQLRLEQQNTALRSGFIASLLMGKNTGAPVHELMTNYQISFRYSHYTAMAIFIENYDEGFWDEQPGAGIDKYAMFKFIITNVIGELVNRSCIGYMTEVDDILACLINLDQGVSDYKQLLLGNINEAKEFIRQNFRIDLIIAVGSLHESMEGIPEAFAEAMNALAT